jgi:signal transduction histidine kinase
MPLKRNLIYLIAGTIIVVLIVLSLIQIYWSETIIINQALNRVNQDINSFHALVKEKEEKLITITKLLSENEQILKTDSKDRSNSKLLIKRTQNQFGLDFLSIIKSDKDHFPDIINPLENFLLNSYSEKELSKIVSGIASVPAEIISSVKEDISKKALIKGEYVDALIIFSIVPLVKSDDEPYHFIIAAELLNNAEDFLDKIHNAIFKDEFYEGKRMGTVTIFSGTTRIATTVLLENNQRAVGTEVSKEVEEQVLINGIPWNGRAFVVDTWYISQYDPIFDPSGKIIGMLYIGQLEKFFVDKKYETILTSIGAVVFIILLSVIIASFMVQQSRKYELEKKKIRFDFIQLLAHELKSPLNAVESYLQLLTMKPSESSSVSQERIVRNSINRIINMRKLIVDMLDLTRIESGEKRREIKEINITEIVNKSIEAHLPLAKEKNIMISHQLVGNHLVKVDPGEIEIILNNLISNAIKYNVENGTVDVSLSCSQNKLEILVNDTGIGLSEDDTKKIFHEFVRIKNEKTNKIQGSGLGLSIVKKIAAFYDGSLSVKSLPDKGSTFKVLLILK